MTYKYILALDPSGSFEEGKGTTGVCLFDGVDKKIILSDAIRAHNFSCKEDYWKEHKQYIDVIRKTYHGNLVVIIEEYMLDPSRALQQSYSKMETSKLIGVLQTFCYECQLPYIMQRPAEVKQRWKDKVLNYKNYIQMIGRHYYLPGTSHILNEHCRDAIRHAVHFATFKNKEEDTYAKHKI